MIRARNVDDERHDLDTRCRFQKEREMSKVRKMVKIDRRIISKIY